MSQRLTLMGKIRLFFMYLKSQKDGVIIDCPFCGSTNVHFTTQEEDRYDDKVEYISTYLCNECHSACANKQEWYRGYEAAE